jgi:hypothetical protein
MRIVKNNRYAILLGALFSLACLALSVSFSPVESAPPVYRDMVRETTTTTGTGTLTLAGASAGYQSFATAGLDGLTVTYRVSVSGGAWEVSDGVFTASGGTLTRGKLRASSTGSRVSLPSGTKTVDVVFSAADAQRIGNFVDVANYATAGAGTSGSPWTGWDTAITWASFTTYRFRTGYYAFAASPSWLQPGIRLIGEAGVYLQHTGSGNAFVMDAGATPGSAWIQNVVVQDLIVLGNYATGAGTITTSASNGSIVGAGTSFTSLAVGNTITRGSGSQNAETRTITAIADDTHCTVDSAWNLGIGAGGSYVVGKTTNGFFLRAIRNSRFAQLAARDVGNAGMWTEALVTNYLENFRTTTFEPVSSLACNVRPKYGLVTAGRPNSTDGTGDTTTTLHVVNPVIEGVEDSGAGIWLTKSSYGITIDNGTSETNAGIGLWLEANLCNINGIDLETNNPRNGGTNHDLLISGVSNRVCPSACSNAVITGHHNILEGGIYNNLTIDGGFKNILIKSAIQTTFTDNGSDTKYVLPLAQTDERFHLGTFIPRAISSSIAAAAFDFDARQGNVCPVFINADFTLNNPTNSTAYQQIQFALISQGAHTIAWGNQYRVANGITLPTSSGANGTIKYVTCVRDYSNSFWDVIQAN